MELKLVCIVLACLLPSITAKDHKKLIVVLIDGLRWDYINDPNLKGIPRIIQNGVRAPFVYPIYPSISYPNYYTIVTGLYAESHGFVGNTMYDPELNQFFRGSDAPNGSKPYWWDEAEPIWVTAEKHGRKAGMYWWAGCEVEIRGVHPTICEAHRYGPGTEDEKVDFLERIDDLVEMFKSSKSTLPSVNEKSKLSLALMYYGPTDHTGHSDGPGSAERIRALKDIDDILDEMQNKLEEAGLENEVNIMVVSDHGMTDLTRPPTEYVDLEKYSEDIKYHVNFGTSSMIVPEDGMIDKLYDEMKNDNIPGIEIYKKEEIPLKYHLKNNKRVSPIFLKVNKGYYVKPLADKLKSGQENFKPSKGAHGYDPYEMEDMRTIFFARGPSFRKGFVTGELHNIDYYNAMCHILGLESLPNNGSWERVKDMLVGADSKSTHTDGDGHNFTATTTSTSSYLILLMFAIITLAYLY